MYWYQDFPEDHPAEGISWVIANEFAKRVNRYDRVKSKSKQTFSLKKASTTHGWLSYKWPAGNPKFSTADYVQFSTIVDDKGSPIRLKQGLDSPVLLLGSSFIATPSLEKGGTIPHYFAYLTGVVPDLVHRNNADFMMPRSIAREGDDFLRNRSVCLFPFPPFVAYKALASLPIFDPDKSSKTLLASYSGPTMHEAIEFSPGTPEKVLSFSPDGMLHIQPANKDSDAVVSIRIKIPDAILEFPYFILGVEFASNDRTTLVVRYSGQTDSLKRNETQAKKEDPFAFATKSDPFITVDFTRDIYLKTPISIKSINFYGVKQPSYFNVRNNAEQK